MRHEWPSLTPKEAVAQETEGLCSHCHHILAEARNKVLFTEPVFITCPLVLWGGRTHAALHS